MNPITVDFETEAIVGNTLVDPPKPVGVAVWIPGQDPFYMSWGHPEFAVGDPRYPAGSTNSTNYGFAHEYLTKLKESEKDLLFHNAPFDISVWNHYFCNARISWLNSGWRRIHDTMYLVFLADPYAATFALKPSAERYLSLAPDEQSTLHDWIVRYVDGATAKTAGAFISRAPADLVASYAIGDVVRTRKLFDLLHAKITDLGMSEAYDRERRMMPITMQGTKNGIKIDRHTLEHHETVYTKALAIADDTIGHLLGNSNLDVGCGEDLARALDANNAAGEWVLTKTGKRSMAKGNLTIKHPEVKVLYEYRSALETCLTTFMRPWLAFSERDSRLHPNWNQVRTSHGGRGLKGARTGRLSSDHPNFQNVPNEFVDKAGAPLPVPDGLVPLPIVRRYCLPEDGHVWIKRDYSSQEIRILAHFEDGSLRLAYIANPDLDPHQMAGELIHKMQGILYARKTIKITGFSIIYGTGATGLSIQLNTGYTEAYTIKEAYLTAMPGVRALMDGVQRRGRRGLPIRTWGGRLYYSEPPRVNEQGRLQEFHYKLLNYLIQGSAADQTKEAICRWEERRKWSDIFLATVHDEINISAPKEEAKEAMARLQEVMNADNFDVPFRSEGFMGPNWADIKKYEDA